MKDRAYFGRHWVRIIEEDLVFFKFIGPVTQGDSQQSNELLRAITDSKSPFYVICDLSELGPMEPEARRMASRWYSQNNIVASVSFGTSWPTRAIAEMVISLLRVMGKQSFPVSFVHSEVEALAWIVEQRRKRAARTA